MKTAIAAMALLALGTTAQAADLELEVQGLKSTEGAVMAAVFADAEGWLSKPVAVARQPAAAAQNGTLRLTLKDLPEGATLAVSLFHDLNGNGRLDRNAMGMPLEPFGVSNDAIGNFGPPKFEQASFVLRSGVAAAPRMVIQLN